MEIIEYNERYLEYVKDLLVELEEYIISIDEDNLDQIHEDYHEYMAICDLKDVKENDGKCFLAIVDNRVVGLVMGIIPEYDKYDYLDYKCPKRGVVTELIVTQNVQSKGVGKELMAKMENYFLSKGCEYVLIDVFAYNKKALEFYKKNGYHSRMIVDIKKIK